MSHLLDEAARNLETLELMPGASWEDVKAQYRFWAQVWHPDRFPPDTRAQRQAEARFKQIGSAYQWLSAHRTLLDSLAAGASPDPDRPRPSPADPAGPAPPDAAPRQAPKRGRGAGRRRRRGSGGSPASRRPRPAVWAGLPMFLPAAALLAVLAVVAALSAPRMGGLRRLLPTLGTHASSASSATRSGPLDPAAAARRSRADGFVRRYNLPNEPWDASVACVPVASLWGHPLTVEPGRGRVLTVVRAGDRLFGDVGRIVTRDGLHYVPLCSPGLGTARSAWSRYLTPDEVERFERTGERVPPDSVRVATMRKAALPGLSRLTPEERSIVEIRCGVESLVRGATAYRPCLELQARGLRP